MVAQRDARIVEMKFPNFLVIGAAKSGTYALHSHLAKHPEVFMSPIKEPHFFAFAGESANSCVGANFPVHDWVKSTEAYLRLFEGSRGALMAGECSVSYLYWPGTSRRIHQFNPDMKLIVSLRNPVDRAYSSFHYARSYGIEPLRTLTEGIQAEEERIRRNQSLLLRYRDLGLYARQLERFFEVFSPSQLKVILYDDLVADQIGTLRDLFRFLGVKDAAPDPLLRANVTKSPNQDNPIHRFINGEHLGRAAIRRMLPLKVRSRLRHAVRELLFSPPPPLELHERLPIQDLFREDIRLLEPLIDRDLKAWLA